MDREREYAEYRTRLLAMGFPEAWVDEELARMRREDEERTPEAGECGAKSG